MNLTFFSRLLEAVLERTKYLIVKISNKSRVSMRISNQLRLALSFLVCIDADNMTGTKREGKLFPVFNIIQFQNTACNGTTRSGVCYTDSECNARGGSVSGSCASGFGVCCLFEIECGQMSAENCTYLRQSGNRMITSPCIYQICKVSNDICRIRFDFISFDIIGPFEGTAVTLPEVLSTDGGLIGDCTSDTFSLTAPGRFAPPVICGFNTGQHMIVDASDACHNANFVLRGTGTRSWDIKVTQFRCGDNHGGDPGCLQWFTGITGTVASFAFPTTATTTLPATTTHLSSQCYTMCWRQEPGTCGICWAPVIPGDRMTTGSFGLSNPVNRKAKGERDGRCLGDYLLIRDAVTIKTGSVEDTFVIGTAPGTTLFSDRVCGRFFSSAKMSTNREESLTICSQRRPFRMAFKTDEDEFVAPQPTIVKAQESETAQIPGGIVGFHLAWSLQEC